MPHTAQHIQKHTNQLNASKLEQWFSEFATKHGNKTSSSANSLSRFGIKNAHSMMAFLDSPRGRIIKDMINEELAKKFNDSRTTQMLLQKRKKRLALILLAMQLALSEEKKAEAKQLNHEIQAQIERILKRNEEEFEQEEEQLKREEHHLEELELCEEAILTFENKIEDKSNELEQVDIALDKLPNEFDEINLRYNFFAEFLDDINSIVNDLSPDLEAIEDEMSSYAKIISSLLDDNKEAEAQQKILEKEALHHKAKMLSTIQTARKEGRVYYNRNAEPVNSPSEADFFIPKGKKLALDPKEGQFYLISQDKVLNQLDPTERKEALNAYRDSKDDIMSVRMQLELKRAQELTHHQSKQSTLTARQQILKQEIQQLRTMHANVQSKFMDLQKSLPNTNTPRPQPTSTANKQIITGPQPRPQQRNIDTHLPNQQNRVMPQAPNQQRSIATQSPAQRATKSLAGVDPTTLTQEQLILRQKLAEALSTKPATAPSPFKTKPKPY